MNKDNIKFLKTEVVDACDVLCKKMGGGFKFGGWINFKNDHNNFWLAGINVNNYSEKVYLEIYSECSYLSQREVIVTVTAQYNSGTQIEFKTYSIQDGLLTLREWERWGLNRYLIMTINDLKKKAHNL